MRDLKATADSPYVFHLGAQAHVGESWHRPYETVMANTIGTLNLLQSIVDHGLELEKFDTAGTSEEYGNVRESVVAPPRLRRARRPDPARALADQPEVDLRDLEGRRRLPDDELLRRVRDPGDRHADVQQLRPAPEPALRHGDDHHAGARARAGSSSAQLEPLRDFCFCTDGVRGHLTVAAQGKPGDVYVYGQGENISMADWAEMILRVGEEGGYWPAGREIVSTARRVRPGASEVMALRVGYDKLHAETGWRPTVSWEEGLRRTIAWYAANRERWVGRVDWMQGEGRDRGKAAAESAPAG